MSPSERMKAWRQRLGISQVAAAERCKVSQPAWSAYEAGKRIPPTVVALRIAEQSKGEIPFDCWGETTEAAEEPAP